MIKKNEDYYVGLDIGTNSVGWAVTDTEYNVIKLRGKNAMGFHLFEEGKPASERRGYRSSKRRSERKKNRIALLKALFDEEICKVDYEFFQRLEDSKFWHDDKTVDQYNSIFNDPNYKDKHYHQEYPTIYHLRKELIENKEKRFDIRLIYLAVAHILKNRGHFLLEGQEFSVENSFEELFDVLNNCLAEEFEITLDKKYLKQMLEILRSHISKTDKKNELLNLFGKDENKIKSEIFTLMVGNKANLSKLFYDKFYDEESLKDIQFSKSDYSESENKYESLLGERMSLIHAVKGIYDWMILSGILMGEKTISLAKVKSYDKHKNDLEKLKNLYKSYLSKKDYFEMFKNLNSKNNYCAYIGISMEKNNKSACSKNDFYDYTKSIISSLDQDNLLKIRILKEIEADTFLPKQTTGDNGIIPNQLHLSELKKILENASKHYGFLKQIDEDKITVMDKILKIMVFRIPYYVGPLNDFHSKNGEGGFAWIVKKNKGSITPWNFEEIVDLPASGERFIRRMTNRCTYLIDCDVIPKDSLLYSKFAMLNEINTLKINGIKIDVETKKDIFENLCCKKRKIRRKDIKTYLMTLGKITEDDEVSGIEDDVKSTLKAYIDFKHILDPQQWDEKIIEECIKSIVLFGGENKILRQRIITLCKEKFKEEQITKICNLKYSGWGRFSKELLTEIYHTEPKTGEVCNIISSLYETNENFKQLLSQEKTFSNHIDIHNAEINGLIRELSYEKLVEGLYCSPAVKRGIWRTLVIVKEIEKIIGTPPKKVFIEVTREEGIKGDKGRKVSRKKHLLDLYKACKEEKSLMESLNEKEERQLRSDKLYLYYTQMGRCMYSGKPIPLDELMSSNSNFDIDHIYPRSKTKDDSIDNKVLVEKNINKRKDDIYPIPPSIKTNDVLKLWQYLYKAELISKVKYERLVRSDDFSDSELAGFINRQIVETGQSTKAVAQALSQIYSEDRTEIVYVKAKNVSDFRQEIINILKVRDVNDYHHARDAYLNIVVGNVYNTKFTKNPLNFIKEASARSYSLNRVFDYDVKRGDCLAWKAGKEGTIQTVLHVMNLKRLQFTRYSHINKSNFYDQMPLKKGKGEIPLKGEDERFNNIDRYGGYTNDSSAYYFLVKHHEKGKIIKTIEYVSVRYVGKIQENPEELLNYCVQNKPHGLGLLMPEILIPKIKINTLFNLDGFVMHISGRSNDSITFKPAVQLILDNDKEKYIKKISKFIEKYKKDKKLKINEKYDNISKEMNLLIYDQLLDKHKEPIYLKRPASQVKAMEKGREKFISLPVEEQCAVILQILVLTKCVFARADLKLIGASSQAGTVTKNKNISNCQKAIIIYQSPTGLYSNEVDLLKL